MSFVPVVNPNKECFPLSFFRYQKAVHRYRRHYRPLLSLSFLVHRELNQIQQSWVYHNLVHRLNFVFEYADATAMRFRAWNTGSRFGRREHGRSEDRDSQQQASALVSGRLAGPRGDRVSPEGRHAGGLCEPGRRLTAVQTVGVRAEACTSGSQLGNCGAGRSLLEES